MNYHYARACVYIYVYIPPSVQALPCSSPSPGYLNFCLSKLSACRAGSSQTIASVFGSGTASATFSDTCCLVDWSSDS